MIQYTASALADIGAAYNWYEDQKEGLGDKFLAEVRAIGGPDRREPLGI